MKKSEQQIPRRLKSARDDKNKGLGRDAESPLYLTLHPGWGYTNLELG
jgi:hypothetical protein